MAGSRRLTLLLPAAGIAALAQRASARGRERRSGLIKLRSIIAFRLDDPEDFHRKIPLALRSATDARQLRYLDAICEIVAQHSPRA
ncbi:MAG: hypothetical protein N2588_08650 [Rhodovarius sp.]|nr:hypothetical protein [Rhodovarius sp.]